MNEFEFSIRFRPGADALMDLFRDHPRLELRNVTCTVGPESMWRVDRVTGPTAALDEFDAVFLDEARCNEGLHDGPCRTTRTYDVLLRRPTTRTVYTYRTGIDCCCSVPAQVVEHIGDGVVFESQRDEAGYHWRVLSPVRKPLHPLLDRLESTLRDGLELSRCGRRDSWGVASPPADVHTATGSFE